jgi:drug/metabolite transporter (DMT)-like permease
VKLIPPITFLCLRAAVATVCFIPAIFIAYHCGGDKNRANLGFSVTKANRVDTFLKLCVMGIFESTLPYVSYGLADIYLPADVATVLMSLSPLCSFFFRYLFTKYDDELKKFVPTKKIVSGILIGFLGAAIVVARPYITSYIEGRELGLTVSQPWVIGIFIVGVLSLSFSTTYWSTYGYYHKPSTEKIGVFIGGIGRNVIGFVIMAIFSPTVDYFLPIIGKPHFGFYPNLELLETWIVILWMGIGSGFIGVISYYYIVQKMGSEKALTSNYMVPVIGNIIGLLYYSEYKNYRYYDYIIQFGGTVVVVIGLILCTMDGLKKRRERRSPHKKSRFSKLKNPYKSLKVFGSSKLSSSSSKSISSIRSTND